MTDDLNRLRAVTLTDDERAQLDAASWQGVALPHQINAVESIVAARTAALLDRIADYENGISWGTSCISCAKTLDSSYAEYVRAEKAAADLAALRAAVTALADEWDGEGIHNNDDPPLYVCDHEARYVISRVRSLLAAAPTETEGTPDE